MRSPRLSLYRVAWSAGPIGNKLTSVQLKASKVAVLKTAIVNCWRVAKVRGTELGHPPFEIQVAMPPLLIRRNMHPLSRSHVSESPLRPDSAARRPR